MAGNENSSKATAKIDITDYKRLKLSEFCDVGCDRLAQAIVEKACEDWIHGRNKELKHPQNGKNLQRQQAERFFRSSWFEMLTGFDGATIIGHLERMVREGCKRKHISRPSAAQNGSSG